MIADLPHDLQGGTVFQNDESVRPVASRLRGNDGEGDLDDALHRFHPRL